MLLEVVVFNFRSALVAAGAGADRIEICDNYYEGGTTPSYGVVSELKERLGIPLFPMVRPRGGDFLYDETEIKVMERDIAFFKSAGCGGIVTGCLSGNGTVDTDLLKHLVKLSSPMELTFHRAFDRVRDQFAALEEVIACGCKRILTSGGQPFAWQGAQRIRELVAKAGSRITIIPGGGISSENIQQLVDTGAHEFHTPARVMKSSEMEYLNEAMQENLETIGVDEAELMKMKRIISNRDLV
jgi:copper homeostasis protein